MVFAGRSGSWDSQKIQPADLLPRHPILISIGGMQDEFFVTLAEQVQVGRKMPNYSHSMVAGGLVEMS